MSLTIAQVRDDLLSKLGIEDFTLAPSLALQDCVIAINGAMQFLQTAGQDYFTREKVTTTIVSGTGLYTFAQTVQAIIGPIRLLSGKPLRALLSRGELDQFDRIFLGTASYGAAAGEPVVYWVENVRSGTTGDIDQINVYLAPTPNAAGSFVAEVVNDAPSYLVSDFTPGTLVLPVAQNYTESIFLPLARMLIIRSSQFSRPDIKEQLQGDAEIALARLGLAGGFPNAVQPEPDRKISA